MFFFFLKPVFILLCRIYIFVDSLDRRTYNDACTCEITTRFREELMRFNRLPDLSSALLLITLLSAHQSFGQEKAAATAPSPKPLIAQICTNCHQPERGTLRGLFEFSAFSVHEMLIRIDNSAEVLGFDEKTFKIVKDSKTGDASMLHLLKKGDEVRIEFIEKNGVKTAALLSIKSQLTVSPAKIMYTEELEKLVSAGPEAGHYALVDSRPDAVVKEGSLPTSISIPYPAFDTLKTRHPDDKKTLLIFYGSSSTDHMASASAEKAEKLGYTNVRIYRDGVNAWSRKDCMVVSARSFREAYVEQGIPNVLLDVRIADEAQKGFILNAVSLPLDALQQSAEKLPLKDPQTPIIIYSDQSAKDAIRAAKALIGAGYRNVKILAGGLAAWRQAGYPVESGSLSTTIVYTALPKQGEIRPEDFSALAANVPPDTLILDVRDTEEGNDGMIRGAKLIPEEGLLNHLADLPRGKKILIHCATGVRAELAYYKLTERGYNTKFLNATIEIGKDGNFRIQKP